MVVIGYFIYLLVLVLMLFVLVGMFVYFGDLLVDWLEKFGFGCMLVVIIVFVVILLFIVGVLLLLILLILC